MIESFSFLLLSFFLFFFLCSFFLSVLYMWPQVNVENNCIVIKIMYLRNRSLLCYTLIHVNIIEKSGNGLMTGVCLGLRTWTCIHLVIKTLIFKTPKTHVNRCIGSVWRCLSITKIKNIQPVMVDINSAQILTLDCTSSSLEVFYQRNMLPYPAASIGACPPGVCQSTVLDGFQLKSLGKNIFK